MNTLHKTGIAGLLAFGLVASAMAAGKAPGKTPEASIPFVHLGSIRNWQADGRDGLWIQDRNRNWYYARTMGPCFGLDWALRIGFDTRSGSSFDRFSSIIAPNEGRCPLQSLTRSEAPPKKVKKAKTEVVLRA